MRLLSILFLAAVEAIAQSYSVTTLAPPPGYLLFNLDGSMNNKGQVLGDAGTSGGAVRFPVLWTGGVPQILPMPSGHVYLAVLDSYKINDAGTVIGTVQESGNTRTHIAVWNGGTPSVVPDAPIPQLCPGPGSGSTTGSSSRSYGINTAGHILGYTSYPDYQVGGLACRGAWIFDGASYRIVPFPVPPQCTGLPPGFGGGVGGNPLAINDADQVLWDVVNNFCGPPYLPPNTFPAADPAVTQPGGSYSFLPLGSLAGAYGNTINNRGEVKGYYTGPTHIVVWDAAGIHDLGFSGYGYMNNLGQVAYISDPQAFSYQIQVWRNGVSAPIQVPPGLPLDVHNVAVLGGFNDAGQIAVQIPGGNAYLLTPAGACAQDVSPQVQVTRGGFRYNRTTQHYTQAISAMNTGSATLTGPISVALDNVPATATLFNTSGTTSCNPPAGSLYLDLAGASLAPGASATATVEFINTAGSGITYNTRVLAGPGRR